MTDLEIKILLSKRGANISDVARAAEVSPQLVGRVIAGKDKSRRVATLISNFLGKPLDALWPGAYPATYRRRSSHRVEMELRAAANISRHAEAT